MGIRGSSRRDQGRTLVARSEIWWAEHPDAGRRPFLILTRQAAIPVLNALLAVPATRTIRQIPTEVILDLNDGMPEECALSLDNLTLVPKELFRTRITRLSVERMREVCRALTLASGCS
ncbi:MAG: type II toxin-antitoxin system PemK/MazF family toxin [Gaiellaceae bacterium]